MNYDREALDAAHGIIVGVLVGIACWAAIYIALTVAGIA